MSERESPAIYKEPHPLSDHPCNIRVRHPAGVRAGLGKPVELIVRGRFPIDPPSEIEERFQGKCLDGKPFTKRGTALLGKYTNLVREAHHYLIISFVYNSTNVERHEEWIAREEKDHEILWYGEVNVCAMWEKARGLSLFTCRLTQKILNDLFKIEGDIYGEGSHLAGLLSPRLNSGCLRAQHHHLQLWMPTP